MNATSCYWSYIDFYTKITYYLHFLQFRQSRRSKIHKQPPEVFLKFFANFTGKQLCWSLFFTKLQAFRSSTLLKIDSYTSIFLWNFRNSEEHLFWRTSERLFPCIDYFIIYLFSESSTVHVLHFYRELLLYYAIKTIELMTHEVISFEEVFHWMKFLAFES